MLEGSRSRCKRKQTEAVVILEEGYRILLQLSPQQSVMLQRKPMGKAKQETL